MVAPRAETIFRDYGRRRAPVGILFACPECSPIIAMPLRCETVEDFRPGEAPELVSNAGPLGFTARCDRCGFRVEMHGDRLPTVAMLKQAEEPEDRWLEWIASDGDFFGRKS